MVKLLRKFKDFGEERAFLIKSFVQKDSFGLVLMILLSISLIISHGSISYGSDVGLGNQVTRYITDKTLLAIINKAQSSENANTSSFVGQEVNGQDLNPINTIQQTALLAFNSIENDLSDFKSTGRGGQIAIYTVQEGDTLSFIASDFGVSVNTIIWANNLKGINAIKPGDELKIPPVSGVIHKVKNGDTLDSIAKKYSADKEKIISFNILPKDGPLQVDEELIIPDGKISSGLIDHYQNTTVKRFAYLPDLGSFFMVPTTGHNWGIVHDRNGVDIANSCGTPIYAAADGTVAISDSVGWNGGFGKFIKLSHANGTETVYAHASKLLVNIGNIVNKGEQIAVMGTTGHSTGCHLHFEVHGARNPLAKY